MHSVVKISPGTEVRIMIKKKEAKLKNNSIT